MSQDGSSGLLFPMWQLVIGGCVLAAVLLSIVPLLRRGPTRMSRALIVIGGTALAIAAVGVMFAGH
ncbi:hypothetical protein [Rugosimonospora acidiphila]